MNDPTKRALPLTEAFGHVRAAHRDEPAEDYAALIDELIAMQGEARVVSVAEVIGVSQATASKVLTRLVREGYVTKAPYRSLFLTDKGKTLAKRCRERRVLVRDFLVSLGVDARTALLDAMGVEHHLSDATLEKMAANLKKKR
jgi:DtxR family manganese transport transcriptional regulator